MINQQQQKKINYIFFIHHSINQSIKIFKLHHPHKKLMDPFNLINLAKSGGYAFLM